MNDRRANSASHVFLIVTTKEKVLGILTFGWITLGISLLPMVLPAVLIIFARGVRPFARAVWVLCSLLPTLAAFLLERHGLAPAVFALSPWGVCLLFLWVGRSPRAVGRQGRRPGDQQQRPEATPHGRTMKFCTPRVWLLPSARFNFTW